MATTVSIAARLAARRDLPPPGVRKSLRVSNGISLRDMGREVGVSAQTIAHYEGGQRHPRPEHLINYVRVLRELQAST